MDKDIEEIKRLAGLLEQEWSPTGKSTYSLGKQEDIDKLVQNEVEFLAKTAKYLDNMRRTVLAGRVLHTNQVNQGITQLIRALANRIEALGEYRDESRKEKP